MISAPKSLLCLVSKNPLRRLADQVLLASMRPPLAAQLMPNRDEVDLKGKRILLTGASSGIGEAAAEKFARRGATVVVAARRQELLDELVDRITAAGGDARAQACDLSDLDAVDEPRTLRLRGIGPRWDRVPKALHDFADQG